MASKSANLQRQLLFSKIILGKSKSKQPILIDLQSDQDSTLSDQQTHCILTTSNSSGQKSHSIALEIKCPQQSSWNGVATNEKDLDFQNGQFNDLPAPSIKKHHPSFPNSTQQQKVDGSQENSSFKPKKSSSLCQSRSFGVKKILGGKINKLIQRKQFLRLQFQNSANELFSIDQAEMCCLSIQSCQNFTPALKKEAQIKCSLKLKRKTRGDTKKEKSVVQISSQDTISSSFTNMELQQVSNYRYQIPGVAKKIRDIFEELQKNRIFYMSRASVKQSPKYLINSVQHELLKRLHLKQMEKRRIIYLE